jgi:hypothetical protein
MEPLGRKLFVAVLLSAYTIAACDSTSEPAITLEPPASIDVAALSPTSARVSWSAVPGATGYELEGGANGAYSPLGTTSQTSLDVTGLTTGAQYRFVVTATSGSERSRPSSPSAPFTVPNEIFAQVTSDITSNRTFYADSTYVLSGFIKVANGATLTIEPGTKVVGDFNIPGSSLFVLRGARIVANGTAERPIVFTSQRPAGQRQPGDWGGIIIIGNGIINRGAPTIIEGTGTPPAINPEQDYSGGTDNDDSSGVLRYVRIEFAGYPTAQDEELNSLTMAAVGQGTTIEYVQVLLGLDDSFEWFGGAVDGRYLISYESADDHFDASEGYIGRNQYLIAFQSIEPDPRADVAGGVATDPQGIENDGCWSENCLGGNNNTNAEPFTIPVFANFTLVGAPSGAWETSGGNYGMMLRRGTGGLYVNGVVTRYSKAAISFRGQNTWARYEEGNFDIRNLYVSETGGVFQAEDLTNDNEENRQFVLDLADHSIEDGDISAAALFAALPETSDATGAADFDWSPAAGSPIATGGLDDFSGLSDALREASAGFVTPTAFRGAADPSGDKWWEGWTYYAHR